MHRRRRRPDAFFLLRYYNADSVAAAAASSDQRAAKCVHTFAVCIDVVERLSNHCTHFNAQRRCARAPPDLTNTWLRVDGRRTESNLYSLIVHPPTQTPTYIDIYCVYACLQSPHICEFINCAVLARGCVCRMSESDKI